MKIKMRRDLNSTLVIFLLSAMVFFIRVISYQNDLAARLVVILSTILCVILVLGKKKEYIFLVLLLLLEFDSEVSPHNYSLIILSISLATLAFKHFFERKKIKCNRVDMLFLLFFMFYGSIAIYEMIEFKHLIDFSYYAIFDAKMYIVIMLSYFLFKEINIGNIIKIMYILTISYIFFVLFGYLNNYSSLNVSTREYVGYSSQLTMILSFVTLKLCIERKVHDLIMFISIAILMVLTANVISQNILIIFSCFTFSFFLVSRKGFIGAFSLLISFVIFAILWGEYFISDNILLKINNISSIFISGSLYSINTSPLIRILEFLNIYSSMSFYQVLGFGFGGYFSDSAYPFPMLGEFDFSSDQISSNIYFLPHNNNYPLLKFGLVYFFISAWLFTKIRSLEGNYRFLLYALWLFSIFNIGFTYIPSITLGLIIANVCKKRNYRSRTNLH